MSGYASRPWLASYDAGVAPAFSPRFADALSAFRQAVASAPERDAIRYFDRRLSYRELDRQSDAFAGVLLERGVEPGDRLAVYLQNVPQFVLSLLAAWKIGVVPVPINPMNRERELSVLLRDCTPKAAVCQDTLFAEVLCNVADRPAVVFTTSPLDYQGRCDARLFAGVERVATPGTEDFHAALEAARGAPAPPSRRPAADDLAFLVYTSGTTGVPKGAMNTHAGAVFSAESLVRWLALEDGGPILALAPLFHITGLVCQLVTAFAAAAPLVLSYRFEPGVMLDSIEEHQPAFMIGAITAYIAFMAVPGATAERFRSLKCLCTGGAPVPPSVLEQFRARFGHYLVQGYGLTETNAPVIFVPRQREAPVDPGSGALSIGLPMPGIDVWISDDEGRPLPFGETGEIVVAGPAVVPGYWNRPGETAAAVRPDGLRTGDVGFMDENGWVYLVDRKKDMIIAGGYKVWPREVEDVLYTHPAVREAAVIGVADAYRGETVKAVVSLRAGQEASPDELRAFCKARMAAYKYPRIVEIVDELPKTPTGKILRRALRAPA